MNRSPVHDESLEGRHGDAVRLVDGDVEVDEALAVEPVHDGVVVVAGRAGTGVDQLVDERVLSLVHSLYEGKYDNF